MAASPGKDAAIKLGANSVVGMGVWNINGITADMLEDTEFGDEYKTFIAGLKDSGQITFNGFYDPADSTGQDVLRTAWEDGTSITDIRCYVDANSYWIPNTASPVSFVLIQSYDVTADKSGLVQCSFTAKVSGKLELL